MKIIEIEQAIIEYCKRSGIKIVRGKIPSDKYHEIRDYLTILKRQYKLRKAFERKDKVKSIKEIKIL